SAGNVSDTTGSLRSGPGERRWALLQEGADSFPEVRRSHGRLLELRFERELLLERRGERVLEKLLGPADREGRPRGPLGGELGDARREAVRGDHLRDEAPVERLRGRKARV